MGNSMDDYGSPSMTGNLPQKRESPAQLEDLAAAAVAAAGVAPEDSAPYSAQDHSNQSHSMNIAGPSASQVEASSAAATKKVVLARKLGTIQKQYEQETGKTSQKILDSQNVVGQQLDDHYKSLWGLPDVISCYLSLCMGKSGFKPWKVQLDPTAAQVTAQVRNFNSYLDRVMIPYVPDDLENKLQDAESALAKAQSGDDLQRLNAEIADLKAQIQNQSRGGFFEFVESDIQTLSHKTSDFNELIDAASSVISVVANEGASLAMAASNPEALAMSEVDGTMKTDKNKIIDTVKQLIRVAASTDTLNRSAQLCINSTCKVDLTGADPVYIYTIFYTYVWLFKDTHCGKTVKQDKLVMAAAQFRANPSAFMSNATVFSSAVNTTAAELVQKSSTPLGPYPVKNPNFDKITAADRYSSNPYG